MSATRESIAWDSSPVFTGRGGAPLEGSDRQTHHLNRTTVSTQVSKRAGYGKLTYLVVRCSVISRPTTVRRPNTAHRSTPQIAASRTTRP